MTDHAALTEQFEAFVPLYGQYMRIAVGQAHLTTSELKALKHASENGGTTQADLVRSLRLSPNAVSKMMDGLAEKGLMVRKTHPQDRRAVVLEVTDDGLVTLQAGLLERRASMADMLAVLDQTECRQLSDILRRLSDRLIELAEER